jgi:hypothetical protein
MSPDDWSHKILAGILAGLMLVAVWTAVVPDAVRLLLG